MPPETMSTDAIAVDRTDFDPIGLVPPGRLGTLLSSARSDRGLTLEEVASSTQGRLSLAGLAAIERGVAPLDDDALRMLAELYELDTVSLVPTRSQLILDLNEGYLAVDDRRSALPHGSPARADVLVRYLSMVYSMRGLEPGTRITLRVEDLDVLGTAFREGAPSLATDLEALMVHAPDQVRRRLRLLDRRVLIPAAGVLVACFAVGSLLLIDRADSTPSPSVSTTIVVVPPQVNAEIGTALTQERSSTDASDRGASSAGVSTTGVSTTGAPVDGEVRIIDPLVIERSDTGAEAPVISATSQTR